MVDKIYEIKNKLLEQVEQDMRDKGATRIDPDMVDMIKDLAAAEKDCWEADYYRTVTEAMGEGQGYSDGRSMGYMGDRAMGYRASGRGSANQYGGSRRGYMGYHDQIESLRMAMDADPTKREEIRREIRALME